MTATTSTRTSYTTTHSLLSCPIGALPAELLIEIFIFCAATNALIPLTLREVCTFWNEVVSASPHVWQVVLLDDGARSITASQKQTELWIERCTPLMFDIQLNVFTPDNLLPLLSPCIPHLSRWRQIVLTGQREEEVTISDLQMVSLDHLLISVGPEDDDLSEFIPKSTFVEYSPLWPGAMAMNVWLGQLPSSHTIPSLRFTTINITEQSLEIHVTAQSILDFLSACPHARTVSFAGFIHTDEAYTPSGTIVNLPHLTSLTLKTTSLTRSILSAIDAPKLSELYLALLNVDIELATSDAYEDGDSDDEAQDFSLSPSSDRATGMGFRKLLARCNPPIRVLEMNFSDMRTKDFRYVFKRLKSLEDFVIVASDMSDTVINLFQDCLPMLRRIELYSCHRFNGDTMINVLRTRGFAALDEVVISGCDGFSGNHAQVLFKELGNKFKDDCFIYTHEGFLLYSQCKSFFIFVLFVLDIIFELPLVEYYLTPKGRAFSPSTNRVETFTSQREVRVLGSRCLHKGRALNALIVVTPMAEGPYKLCDVPTVVGEPGDYAESFYWDMAITHNCYLRALNSVWINAPKVHPADELSFVGYCLVLTQAVHEHHDMEEEAVFPVLQEKLDMKSNIDEHAAFLPAMMDFNNYCRKVQAGMEPYDGTKMREMLRAFGDGLAQHLLDEIPTITPDKMHQFDKPALNALIQDVKKHVKASSPLTVFPFTITHHDYSQVPRWPPAPAPIMWMMRNLFGRWNQSLWKFSPFDLQGNPQTYE